MDMVFVFYLVDSTVTASVVMVATAYLAYIVDTASNANRVGIVLYYEKALAAWFELHDYPVTPAAVRGAKRNKLVEGSIPLTKQTLSLLKLLISKLPTFEYEALFAASTLDELQILMAE